MRNRRIAWHLRGPIKRNYFQLVKIGQETPVASVQCAEHSVQYTVKLNTQWLARVGGGAVSRVRFGGDMVDGLDDSCETAHH